MDGVLKVIDWLGITIAQLQQQLEAANATIATQRQAIEDLTKAMEGLKNAPS